MTKCNFCKKDIYTYSGPRWAQTGIELSLKDNEDVTITLCWECYNTYKKEVELIV